MDDIVLELPSGYSLHRDSTNIWWIWKGGMNMALRIEPSIRCGPGGSIDREIEDFAKAMCDG